MKPVRIVRHGLLVAVLTTLLVSCANSNPGSAGSGAESSEITSGSLAASSPPPEGSGVESPQAPQPGQPSVNVARLPIGGRSTGDGAAQCVRVSWLADIPKGVSRISIAGTAFTPPGIFKTGGKGCGNQQPLCKEFTPQHTDCLLPVVQVKDVDTTVVLTLSGTAACVDKASCAYLAQNTEPGSIDLQAQSGVVGPPTTTTTGKKNAPNSGPGS